jgi:hypothetical protein
MVAPYVLRRREYWIGGARVAQRSRRHVYLQVAPYEVALESRCRQLVQAHAWMPRSGGWPAQLLLSAAHPIPSPERGQHWAPRLRASEACTSKLMRCADGGRTPAAAARSRRALCPLVKSHGAYWCEWTWVVVEELMGISREER